jgi:hypothetical protein
MVRAKYWRGLCNKIPSSGSSLNYKPLLTLHKAYQSPLSHPRAISDYLNSMIHRLVLLLLLAAVPVLNAQTPAAPPAAGAGAGAATRPLFRASLPGGTYAVATASMISVSSHEYLVDGIARVTEVNIDTIGSLLARFYYIEPNLPNAPLGVGAATIDKANQLLLEAGERSGQDVWKKVVKSYPTTTHARTVEFRVENKEQLTRIFDAADEAFRLQRPKTVAIQ